MLVARFEFERCAQCVANRQADETADTTIQNCFARAL